MAGIFVGATMAWGDVLAPRVVTDKSVDTHSLESIVRDVCRPEMNEEEKAVALYEYVRRTIFHYEQRGEKQDQVYDLDALRQINTYGYSFCTQQMLVLTHLWRTADIREHVHGRRDFWVRAECMTGAEAEQSADQRAGLDAIALRAVFQHNMFARPYLVPGSNNVTVTVANPEVLPYQPFEVHYAWQEAGQEKSNFQRITTSPMTYAIEVGGKEMPKMVRFELKVRP